MSLEVTIFNSAGEIVRHLYNGASQNFAGGFQLSENVLTEGGTTDAVLTMGGLTQNGSNQVNWNGTNDGGQMVSGGIYTIQMLLKDPFGKTQSWTKNLSVLSEAPPQSICIYNSAGELVATLPTSAVTKNIISSFGFGGNGKTAFVVGAGSGIPLMLEDVNGKPHADSWNGKSNSGQYVASGSYLAQLTEESGGETILMTKGFEVLGVPSGNFSVIEGPNPVTHGDPQMVFALSGVATGDTVVLRLYDLDGELVAWASAPAGSSRLVMPVNLRWGDGIYLAVLNEQNGDAVISRQVSRIALAR